MAELQLDRHPTPIDPELLQSEPEALANRPKRKSSCESDEPRSRKRLSAEAWESKRSIIAKLYQVEKRPLKEVMEIMQRDYQFNATVKMYKSRIWKWGLDKKLKSDEVLAILIMKRERDIQGKESVFHIRSQPVDLDNIQRYLKRKPKLMEDFQAGRRPSHQTIAEVHCRTPSPPPERIMPLSAEMRNMEQVLTMFRDCVDGEFLTGKWQCEFDVSCEGSDGDRSIELFERVITSFALVNRCMAREDKLDLITVLTPSFDMLMKIYKAESPILLLRTPALIWYLDRHHQHNLLPLVVTFMSDLCKGTQNTNPAMAHIWLLLENTKFSDYQELSLRLYEMLCPRIEQRIGSANYLTHVLYNDYTDCLYEGKRTADAEYVLRGHLSRAQATGKRHAWLSELAFDHNATMTAMLEEEGRLEEALRVTINYIRENELSEEQEALMILQVGVRFNRLEDPERALPCFKQAFRLAVDLDLDERVFLTCSANLEKLLAQLGHDRRSDQILQYRLKRLSSFAEASREYCKHDEIEELETAVDPNFPEWLWSPEEQPFELEPIWRTPPNFYSPPSISTLASTIAPMAKRAPDRLDMFGGSAMPSPERQNSSEYPYLLSPQPEWATEFSQSTNTSIIASPAKFHYSPPEQDHPQPPEMMVSRTPRRDCYR